MLAATAADFSIPDYLKPLRALQLGVGTGAGTGVLPEEHPSAWWANIKGRKRWIFHPPDASGSTSVLFADAPRSCTVSHRWMTTLHCDQKEGDVLWVPGGWSHETCSLDAYSVGLGGITFEGADLTHQSTSEWPCSSGAAAFESQLNVRTPHQYRLDEVPYCQNHECPSLPTRPLCARPP